jgi:hypothetical protein
MTDMKRSICAHRHTLALVRFFRIYVTLSELCEMKLYGV